MGTIPRYVNVQVVTLLTFLLAGASDAIAQAAQSATSDLKVTLLGTSTPNPLPDRFGPSTLVEAGNERLLFDCGRGATIRLWQLRIPLGTVKLFITHLHSDHTVGIPDLWLTGFAPLPYGRRYESFAVYGPNGTAEMMSYLEKAYKADIENRRGFISNFSSQQLAVFAGAARYQLSFAATGLNALLSPPLPLTSAINRPTIFTNGSTLTTRGANGLPLPHPPQDRRRGDGCRL